MINFLACSQMAVVEKAMAPHSSTLAWKIPWTEEPGRLQSMGSLRVGHDWATSLSYTFHSHTLEKEVATHSSVLAWRIPGTGEPGGLPSVGSHRVGHDWSDLAAAVAANGCGAKLCIFMVKWYFPKRILRRVALLYIFQSSLMSGLIEDSWISLSVCAFNLCDMFWLKHMKKIWSHTDKSLEKGKLFSLSF